MQRGHTDQSKTKQGKISGVGDRGWGLELVDIGKAPRGGGSDIYLNHTFYRKY